MQNTKTIILGLITTLLLASCTIQGEAWTTTNSSSVQKTALEPIKAIIPTQCSAELLRTAVFREESTKVLVYDGSASYSNIPAELT